MFELILLPDAEKTFATAQRPLAAKLARCFRQLERNPHRHPNITALTGRLAGFRRYRVGDYRVIYRIDSATQTVYVYKIVHRSEAYR
jgi:mRNA interferase RelE/StbE